MGAAYRYYRVVALLGKRRQWVKTGKSRNEQMLSGLLPDTSFIPSFFETRIQVASA
jgi:hypothetical protein